MYTGRRYSTGGNRRQNTRSCDRSSYNRFELLRMTDENVELEPEANEPGTTLDEQQKEISKNVKIILQQMQTIHRKEEEIARLDRKLHHMKTEIAQYQQMGCGTGRNVSWGRNVDTQREPVNRWSKKTEQRGTGKERRKSSGDWRKGAGQWNGSVVQEPKQAVPQKAIPDKKKDETQQKRKTEKRKETQVKEAVTKWSFGLLYKLVNWLWDNGHATVFQSKCLKLREHQEKLIDVLKWSTGCLKYSIAVQEYIEDLLKKIIELALRSADNESMTDLPEAVESLQLPLKEQLDILSIMSTTSRVDEQINQFLPTNIVKEQNQRGQAVEQAAPSGNSDWVEKRMEENCAGLNNIALHPDEHQSTSKANISGNDTPKVKQPAVPKVKAV